MGAVVPRVLLMKLPLSIAVVLTVLGLWSYKKSQQRKVDETPQAARLRIYKRCIEEVNEEHRRRNALAAEGKAS